MLAAMAKDSIIYNHDGMELPVDDWKHGEHSFVELTHVIQSTHDAAQTCAVKAINRMQTMRNWLIGYYIVEFEQHGKDRAEYGSQLLKKLEERVNRKGLNVTLFKNARNFYLLYPQMVDNFVFLNVPLSNCEGIPKSPTLSDFLSTKLEKEKSPTVLDQLKDSEFSHENLGQLNAYVSYYRENEMQPGDNPPIGILLCTRKGKKMVEYALAGMDNQLFVSTYMLQLPDKKTLEDFLLKQLDKNK